MRLGGWGGGGRGSRGEGVISEEGQLISHWYATLPPWSLQYQILSFNSSGLKKFFLLPFLPIQTRHSFSFQIVSL